MQKRSTPSKPNEIQTTPTLIHKLNQEMLKLRAQYALPKMNPPRSIISSNDVAATKIRALSSMYRAKVIDAYRNRRIFSIFESNQTLKEILLQRGWIEKLPPGAHARLSVLSEDVLLRNAKKGNDYEAVVISNIINHFPAFFIWQPKNFHDMHADILPYRNRIRRTHHLDFTHKAGLMNCTGQEHWFRTAELGIIPYPRAYCLANAEELDEFVEDYRQTQCRNLLRFVIEKSTEPYKIIDNDKGTVPYSILTYALNYIKQQLTDWEHQFLDDTHGQSGFDESEFMQFLANSLSLMVGHGKINTRIDELNRFVGFARHYLGKIEEKRPDYKWDGTQNLWILKPGNQCRGFGIVVRSCLADILQYATKNAKNKYIVQKYVERPLLIYKCKFDIRLYMLMTIGEKTVSIWFYKDCYFKISSQEYTIENLHESIHITNFTIQKRFNVDTNLDPRLPKNHMWSLEQFKSYLKEQGAPKDTWSKIFKSFADTIVPIVLASFEETELIQNAFELYGCDFMLDEQYNPVLIEINHTPELTPSTDVTARLCPMVVKDLVKVVVDFSKNSLAETGLFEKVYEINYESKQDFHPDEGLFINGKTLKLHFQQECVSRNTSFGKSFKSVDKNSDKSKTNSYSSTFKQRKKSKSPDWRSPRKDLRDALRTKNTK